MNTRPMLFHCLPLAVGTVLLLGSCKDQQADQSAWLEGELNRLELTHQLALAQYRLDQAPVDHRERLAEIDRALASLARQAVELRQRHATLLADVENLEERSRQAATDLAKDALASQTRKREHAIGQHHPTLTLGPARVFHDAVVTAIDDAGVTVRHPDGISRVDYFELTPEQRDQFGLDEFSATAALRLERLDAINHDRWIEQEMVAVRQQQLAAREAAARREADEERTRLLVAAARVAAQPRVSHLSAAGRLSGSSSPHWREATSDDYRWRRSVYYHPAYYTCPSPVFGRSRTSYQPSATVGRSGTTAPARTRPTASAPARTTHPAVAPRQGRTPSPAQTTPTRR